MGCSYENLHKIAAQGGWPAFPSPPPILGRRPHPSSDAHHLPGFLRTKVGTLGKVPKRDPDPAHVYLKDGPPPRGGREGEDPGFPPTCAPPPCLRSGAEEEDDGEDACAPRWAVMLGKDLEPGPPQTLHPKKC